LLKGAFFEWGFSPAEEKANPVEVGETLRLKRFGFLLRQCISHSGEAAIAQQWRSPEWLMQIKAETL